MFPSNQKRLRKINHFLPFLTTDSTAAEAAVVAMGAVGVVVAKSVAMEVAAWEKREPKQEWYSRINK